jgi:hypothetical protein
MGGSNGVNYLENAMVDVFIAAGPYGIDALHSVAQAWKDCFDNVNLTFADGMGHTMLVMRIRQNGPFTEIGKGENLVLTYRYIYDEEPDPTGDTLVVTGDGADTHLTIGPNGTYTYSAQHNGMDAYKGGGDGLAGDFYWVLFDGSTYGIGIGPTIASTGSPLWKKVPDSSLITGTTYSHVGGVSTTGTETVT